MSATTARPARRRGLWLFAVPLVVGAGLVAFVAALPERIETRASVGVRVDALALYSKLVAYEEWPSWFPELVAAKASGGAIAIDPGDAQRDPIIRWPVAPNASASASPSTRASTSPTAPSERLVIRSASPTSGLRYERESAEELRAHGAVLWQLAGGTLIVEWIEVSAPEASLVARALAWARAGERQRALDARLDALVVSGGWERVDI